MASSRSKSTGASSSSSLQNTIDASKHPGFVNLGNTCFLNSALQAISATQSLKELYLPTSEGLLHHDDENIQTSTPASPLVSSQATHGALSSYENDDSSHSSQLALARSKSPILRLADEELARRSGRSISRPSSTSMDSSIRSITRNGAVTTASADRSSTHESARSSFENGKAPYEISSSDFPLHTAFRKVLEKTWNEGQLQSTTKRKPNTSGKASAVNPRPLLNVISSKYDQYGQYAQQDGHELLRHLLDSLRMEEVDVIRKLQPEDQKKCHGPSNAQDKDFVTDDEKLKPLIDNLFCGKLLSLVVCEGCRHVSHTYEDFYDISLSLRPDAENKDRAKRKSIRSMADRWRRTTSTSRSSAHRSRPVHDTVVSLREGQAESVSDTEQVDDPGSSNAESSIIRPRSAADKTRIDANSREGAKTFIKRQVQGEESDLEQETERLSLTPSQDKRRDISSNASSLLRAVSGRRTPSSRAASPLRRATNLEEVEKKDSRSNQSDDKSHCLRDYRHKHSRQHSTQQQYLNRLLSESAPPQPQANLSALLWGRRTPSAQEPDRSMKDGSEMETQQAGTGLARALHQFTSVEVLDGPNTYACKRCWRLLNPPSSEEREKHRLRRMRRGKDADESEMSSDDQSSSDEEEKERHQRLELSSKEETSQSSISSKMSAASTSITFSSDPVEHDARALGLDMNPTSAESNVTRPAVIVSSANSSAADTPTLGSPSQQLKGSQTPPQVPDRVQNGLHPLLQAPKPVPGPLQLGNPVSSDEASNGDADLSSGSSNEEDARLTKQSAVRYAEGTNESRRNSNERHTIRRKRSSHSLQRRALKRFLIAETPKVLVFHFKRFQATGRGFGSFTSSFRKIDDYVSFPEYLDVSPWLAPPREEYDRHGHLKRSSDPRVLGRRDEHLPVDSEKKTHRWTWHSRRHENDSLAKTAEQSGNPRYRLYAVVVHQGSMSGGHYTAYVLSDRATDRVKKLALQHENTNGNKQEVSQAASSQGEQSIADGAPPSNTSIHGGQTGVLSSVSSLDSHNEIGLSNEPQVESTYAASEVSKGSRTSRPGSMELRLEDRTNEAKEERHWIFTSDTVVRPASRDEVLKAQAYMLFYEQL